MNRGLQLILINKQANLLAIYILCQRGIGMAGQAIGIFELLPKACCGGPNQEQ